MKDFVHLAGSVINGYAFCDIEKQKTHRQERAQWTIDHPYTALLDPSRFPRCPATARQLPRRRSTS